MAHAQRAIPKRLYAEGEYLGAYLGRPGDPRNDDDLTPCPACDGDGVRWILNESGKKEREMCPACEGARFLDTDGYPYKPQEEA
jgi:hypothetical protein